MLYDTLNRDYISSSCISIHLYLSYFLYLVLFYLYILSSLRNIRVIVGTLSPRNDLLNLRGITTQYNFLYSFPLGSKVESSITVLIANSILNKFLELGAMI